MTLTADWVHLPLVRALGWALVHFLWEGALIALALAAALPFCRSARVRYVAACAALLAMLVAFSVTLAVSMPDQGILVPSPRTMAAVAGLDAGAGLAVREPATMDRIREALPWLVPFWMAGALLVGFYRLAGWMAAQRMRRQGVCAAPAQWQERLAALARRMGVSKPLILLESSLAEVPMVVGLLRPVILLPAGLLAGQPASLLEAVLLHELAHIRRLDYLVNLIQTVVESLLFYHPAVWWVSGLMRAERENCCDDAVVAIQGDAHAYATALVTLEELRSVEREPALAATGGSLMHRIRRLLNQPDRPRAAAALIVSMGLLIGLFCLFAAAQQTDKDQPQGAAPAQRETVSKPLSEKAKKKREAALRRESESPYLKWLTEDVAYIITEEERAAFKRLQTDEERERFIEQFWVRRDPTPGTPENEFKEEHYRRIGYANEHFASLQAGLVGWKSDRGRIYIIYGPPDEIEDHRPEAQQWRYRHIEGVGNNVIVELIVEFVDPARSGEFRMTKDPREKETTKK